MLHLHARRLARRLNFRWVYPFSPSKQAAPGFTLIELLTVIAIAGVLASIAAVGWQVYATTARLRSGQDEIWQSIRQSQTTATQQRVIWQTSFREWGSIVQIAVHPASSTPVSWQSLEPTLRIDPTETTLDQANGIYRVQFDEYGNINGQLGRITLMSVDHPRNKRCVITSTLLGTLRKASGNPTPDADGRFCY